jgi:hypothetical protein
MRKCLITLAAIAAFATPAFAESPFETLAPSFDVRAIQLMLRTLETGARIANDPDVRARMSCHKLKGETERRISCGHAALEIRGVIMDAPPSIIVDDTFANRFADFGLVTIVSRINVEHASFPAAALPREVPIRMAMASVRRSFDYASCLDNVNGRLTRVDCHTMIITTWDDTVAATFDDPHFMSPLSFSNFPMIESPPILNSEYDDVIFLLAPTASVDTMLADENAH